MKKLLMLLSLAVGLSPIAMAAPVKDDAQQLKQATQAAMTVYRNQGMQALQQAVTDCYGQVGYASAFCVYLDVTGREIDFTVARAYKDLGRNVPPSTFFQGAAFGQRTASYYIVHKHTRQESNAHMQKIQKHIRQQVAKNLFPNI